MMKATEVTAGMAESSGSLYRRVNGLKVTCRLPACTPGSAPGQTFGKAGIPRDRHGHPRRVPREDRREDVSVSSDFPVHLATSRTRMRILADLSDTRAFPREDPREDVRN